MFSLKTLILSVSSLLIVFAAWAGFQNNQTKKAEFEIEGNWYGLPEAKVFKDDYNGPPAAGEYLSYLPNVVPLKEEGYRVHHVRMDVVAQIIEVAPGVRYKAWTFGGTVPGPVLHVREGDKVVFTMKNRSNEVVKVTAPAKGVIQSPYMRQLQQNNPQNPRAVKLPMLHSMDLHSGTEAASDKWRSIPPGMSIQFEWIANYPGVYLYHCGVPPVLMHMAMGQYGMVIVSPKEGFPTDDKVDESFAIVQSEFYLEQGADSLYSFNFDAAKAKQPFIVAFNGHQNALVKNPLVVEKGDRVRLYVLNVGPNDGSSIHLIGGIFDRVWYEGHPANLMRGMQTVLLGASNGAVMEFIVPEEGTYHLVDHEMADHMNGAMGLITTQKPDELQLKQNHKH